jgi:RHH-type proline utilization regulon transcriptional repressor/proline dehydrogenase/delta 1-pyrroline-5-carboxylate dehydrogenase
MQDAAEQIESRAREIGRAIFARAREADGASVAGWVQKQMMDWGMRDEQVKGQLFRFVDVLPALAAPNLVTGHLREYLWSVRNRLPGPAATIVDWLPADGWTSRGVAAAARFGAKAMARHFIAARDLQEAAGAVTKLRGQQLGFTVDLLGEAILSDAEARRYQQTYLHLIAGLASAVQKWDEESQLDRDGEGRPIPRANVSVKLSALFSQFDPIDPQGTSAAVRERLRPILRLARDRGVFVNIDMEQYSFKDTTIQIFREILDEPAFRDWPDVGIAMQAYLRDCGEDLRALAAWAERRGTPVWVRLVKGAYWDFETIIAAQNGWPVPVFSRKWETDANYEEQTAFLIEHHQWLRPAIASHNVRSIGKALALVEDMGLGPRSIEFQMLYGMADPLKSALVAMGQRVRVYAPVGELLPGMAYLVRRLLENTSNESFLRAGFLEHVPEEQLLMNPASAESATNVPSPGLSPASSPGAPFPSAPALPKFQNAPLTDFSREESRRRMRDALEALRAQLGKTYPLIINGKLIEREKTIASFDPSHGTRLVGKAAAATLDDAQQAVAAAKSAFASWRDAGVETRARLLEKCAAILRRRRFELSALEVLETAKQWREADGDVAEAIDFCAFYAHEARRLATPQRRDVPGEENQTFYDARGVCVVIAPWNFPLAILCGMTTAALAAGNTVVMKPAEQSPIIAAKLMEVFTEAGIPDGVVNYLPGVGEEIGPVLVNHLDVAVVAFTGSRSVGLSIQADAARTPPGQRHLKKVITELGGKNAIIIDEDADLDEAVHGVVASAFGYAGQKCSACSRVIALASVHDAFLERLIEATRSLKIGPAEDPSCTIGPVIDDVARKRILAAIEKGKGDAKLAFAVDVGSLAGEGYYVAPHIFDDVPENSSLAQEEIFGPVLAVMKAGTLEEALRIANGTPYALTGGIYSRSPDHLEKARREFRVGNLYINRKITGALVDRQPFGGFQLSGGGTKAGGSDYLLNFLLTRTITENTLRHGFAPSTSE